MVVDCEKFTVIISRDVELPDQSSYEFKSWIVGLEKDGASNAADGVLAYAISEDGRRFSLVTRSKGKVSVCFDLKATLKLVTGEQYPGSSLARSIVTRLPFDYTTLPMWLIGIAFRLLTRSTNLDGIPDYPSYPVDNSADILFSVAHGNPSRRPLSWPDSKRYAVALSHDVDSAWIFQNGRWLDAFMTAEEQIGVRSAWYTVPIATQSIYCRKGLDKLVQAGHEVGVHGFTHDPAFIDKDYDLLCEILSRAHKVMDQFSNHPLGYRAPWLSRNKMLHRALRETGYLYDSSSPSADILRNNKTSNNGCCTLFPFFSEGQIILPITLPQDASYRALGKNPAAFWDYIFSLVQLIKNWNGLALISTHIQPHHSANPEMLNGYVRLLQRLSRDRDAWFAMPREIADWSRINRVV